MKQIIPNCKEKGKYVEKKFINWLNKYNIPYFYIQQDLKTCSKSLKTDFGTKRPDFIILIPYFGFILVNIKYKKLNKAFNSFPIDNRELKKYEYLQRYFNIPLWYVLSNDIVKYEKWFWISISKILNHVDNPKTQKFISKKSGMEFFSILKKEFKIIINKKDITTFLS